MRCMVDLNRDAHLTQSDFIDRLFQHSHGTDKRSRLTPFVDFTSDEFNGLMLYLSGIALLESAEKSRSSATMKQIVSSLKDRCQHKQGDVSKISISLNSCHGILAYLRDGLKLQADLSVFFDKLMPPFMAEIQASLQLQVMLKQLDKTHLAVILTAKELPEGQKLGVLLQKLFAKDVGRIVSMQLGFNAFEIKEYYLSYQQYKQTQNSIPSPASTATSQVRVTATAVSSSEQQIEQQKGTEETSPLVLN